MKNLYTRGFGITAVIVLIAVVIAGAGGAYFYVEQEKKAEDVTESESLVSESDEESVEAEEVKESDASKAEKQPITVATNVHPKVNAEVYIYEDPSGIANRVNITCKVGTERQVSDFYIYTGDGSEYRLSPVAGRDQVAQAHTYSNSTEFYTTYTVKCVPVYDSTDSPYADLSSYVGTAKITSPLELTVLPPPVQFDAEIVAKIKPIDSDPEVASAIASYEGITAADSADELKLHIISGEYGDASDEDEFGYTEGYSVGQPLEGWSLRGYSKDHAANGEKIVILWFDKEERGPEPMVFMREDNVWKWSPLASFGYSISAGLI